jgi:hypothetical protein
MKRLHLTYPALMFHAIEQIRHTRLADASRLGKIAYAPLSAIAKQIQYNQLRERERILLSLAQKAVSTNQAQTQLFRQSTCRKPRLL